MHRPNLLVRLSRLLVISCALLSCAACAGNRNGALPAAPETAEAQWPVSLPVDGVQPWESQTGRAAGAIDSSSEFTPGVERFLEGARGAGSVSDLGEASRLHGGNGGAKTVAWAIYRLDLAADMPGALSIDTNYRPAQGGGASSYYLGLSDYSRGRWTWLGPFSGNNNVRLAGELIPDGDYSSDAGHMFICVLAYDGSNVDVVGVALNERSGADTTAPPAPTGLTLTQVAGGLEAQWNSVLAGDLAGYRIYYSRQQILNLHASGVKSLTSLEGLTRCVIPLSAGNWFVVVSAVDTSGNESASSASQQATAAGGSVPNLQLGLPGPSVLRGETLDLDLAGADSFDLDLDGDGVYEITDSTTSTVSLDTSAPGLLRANVRGSSGTAVAHGGVSVLVFANTRPAATVSASPSSGDAPLNVSFTGEAEDAEDAPAALSYAWDMNGDGMFEAGNNTLTPPAHSYVEPGFYNARLRVTDSEGAWSVATAGVLVTGSGPNQMPTGFMGTDVPGGDVPITVHFTSTNVTDPDGTIVQYDWDFDSDGIWDAYDAPGSLDWTYTKPGSIDITLRVTDNDGGRALIFDNLDFTVAGNNPPVANLLPVTQSGNVPLSINFNASGSTAGGDPGDSIVLYEWDFDGDGNYDGYGTDPTITHVYSGAGAFTAKLRVTDEVGNQGTDTSVISANSPPAAVLDLLPDTVNKLDEIKLDAGRSSDTDGTIVSYEWDIDGNGSFETNSGTDSLISTNPPSIGHFQLRLRVTDDDGAVSVASATLHVHGFNNSTLDSTDSTGHSSSMTFINGNPAIAYVDTTAQGLHFIRASNPAGTAWAAPVLVDTIFDSDQYLSLAQVNGKPAIACFSSDVVSGELRYVQAADAAGSAWNAPLVLDGFGGSSTSFPSMVVANGKPAIAYVDSDVIELLYVSASDADGSLWNMPVTVSGGVGSFSALAVVGGNPAIAFSDAFSVRYVRASDSLGNAWGTPTPIDVSDVGKHICMIVVNGRPAVSYSGLNNLRYSRATDSLGGAWPQPITVDNTAASGNFSSLTVVDGQPAISYADEGNQIVRYVRSSDANGMSWTAPRRVDAGSFMGGRTGLLPIGDGIGICYTDLFNGDLRFALGF